MARHCEACTGCVTDRKRREQADDSCRGVETRGITPEERDNLLKLLYAGTTIQLADAIKELVRS